MSTQARIDAADISEGNILIHFADDTSVLFQAQFLFDAREQDGNLNILNREEEQQDTDQVDEPQS